MVEEVKKESEESKEKKVNTLVTEECEESAGLGLSPCSPFFEFSNF
jgi:hypothetical protein